MKRILITLLAVVALLSSVAVVANAISINVTTSDYGEMLPTDAKFTKTTTTVRAYGNYDYLNFYINSVYDDKYFFYEIYADEEMKKPVASDYVYCETRGKYTYSPWIKLKGVFKTGTYYGVTYAAEIDDEGNVSVSQSSFQEFKFVVNRTTEFKRQIVLLKNPTNTVNGPTIKWYKLSNNVSKYVVYRRSMTGTKWYKVATVNGKTYSYTDKSLKNKNAKYIYTVKAIDKKGVASRYQYNGATVLFAKAPVVSSVATVSDNRVQVKWNNTSNSAYYRVYRSENGGSWELLNNKFKGTTYYDTTAENGKNYKYTVRAVIPTSNGNATSGYYNVNKTVDFVEQPTINPVEVTENGLKIIWGKVDGAASYTVYRKTLKIGDKWENIGKTSSDVLEFTDTTANSESAFIYTVRSEGKTSRGSYSSKGVEYFTFAQPEFTVSYESNCVKLKWGAISAADSYNILQKYDDGTWGIYDKTENTEYIIYTYNYLNVTLSVQAVRGEMKSEYKTDVESIVYYPAITPSFAVYKDYTEISWYNYYAEKYNVYKKLKSEPDSEYKLIYSGTETSFKDTDVEYDVTYTYQVRGVWNSVEQTTNIISKNSTKYSPDKYIKSFSPYIENSNYVTYGYVSGYKKISKWYWFDKKEQNTSKKMKEAIYYSTADNWRKVEGSTMCLYGSENSTILQFSYVVYDGNGSTPIDGFVKTVDAENICFAPQFTMEPTKTGFNVKWNAVENAEKYKVSVTIDGQKFYEKTIEANGSEKYSVEIANVVYEAYSDWLRADISVTAVHSNGNESVKGIWEYALRKAPVLKKAVPKDNSIYVMWDAIETGSLYRCVIFRKAEGETSWTKISSKAYSSGNNVTINGVEYNDVCYYVDKNVKSGKKYTYTVRLYNTETKEYISYYDTKGITATAK